MPLFIHKKERHVVELIKRHVDRVVEAVYLVQQALNLLLEGKREESMAFTKKVHEKEHEADIVRREIDKEMFQGAFMPSLREALFVTVDSVDKVANRSEKLGDFLTLISPEIPVAIRDELRLMGELTSECAKKLKDAVYHLFTDMGTVHEDSLEISRLEAQVDKYAWKVIEKVFKKLEIEKFSHRMMLREMVIHLSSITNKMEDTSDRLDVIALRIIT